jgi:NADH-quinone oxidoreductase subunit H
MITVSCLATILFFGGWLSPFPQTRLFGWTHYIPAAVFALAGLALIVHGLRYITVWGRIFLPVIGIALVGLGILCGQPGVVEFIQGPFWFLSKIAVFLFIYVWARGTLPRFRYDQLMNFGWKVLLPLSILNVVITSLAIVLTQK